MATKHKMRTVLQLSDDEEIELEVAFTFWPGSAAVLWGDNMHPEEPATVEFAGAKPESFSGLAEVWFETTEGQDAAFEAVADDDEAAREYAAELRADR